MKIKNSEISKIKKANLNKIDLTDDNVKILDVSPTLNVKNNNGNDIIDDEYIDEATYDIDLNGIMYSEESPIDQNNNIDNIKSFEVLEAVFFEELDSMIKVNSYELQEIELEINILNEQEEDIALIEEVKYLEQKLEDIIKRFEKIVEKYDHIYENLDYDTIRQMNDYYMNDLLDDYKDFLKNGELWKDSAKSKEEIEECINIINSIIEIENKKSELKDKIDTKLYKFDIRDNEFEKLKNQYYSIDKLNDFIEDFNKSQENSLDKIKKLVEEPIKVKTSIIYQKNLNISLSKAISGTLLMASAAVIPPTKKGNLLRIGIMTMAISKLSNVIKQEEQEKVKFDFDVTSYETEINNNIKGIHNVIKDIDNAFDDISFMRNKIKKELGDYINDVPEFKTLLVNINKVEKELTIQQEIAKNYSNEFSKTLHENNEKIKKLDKYPN